MHHPPETDPSPTETGEPVPASLPPERDFAEGQDDPLQAEELERQQDA